MSTTKRLLTREDVPGRAWWPFMEKVNKLISGTSTENDVITLDDCPLRIWSKLFEKVNVAIKKGSIEGMQITREDIPNLPTGAQDIWFPGLTIVNKEVFGVVSPDVVRNFAAYALYDKSSFEAYCPKEYLSQYPDHWKYVQSAPWIAVVFDVENISNTVKLSYAVDGEEVAMNLSPNPNFVLSEDSKTYTFLKSSNGYNLIEVVRELQLSDWKGKTIEVHLKDEEGNVIATASCTMPANAVTLPTGKLNSLTANVIKDRETWKKYIPASYAEDYTYEDSEPSLPWLVINYDKVVEEENTGVALNISVGGVPVKFGGNSATVGTVSEDTRTFTTKKDAGFVMFELKGDLGVENSADKDVIVLASNCVSPNVAYAKA